MKWLIFLHFASFLFSSKRAFSSSVNLISSLSFRILFAIGNPPLNVFLGLRVHPNKLKIDKKEADPKGLLHQFFVSVRTLTVLAHILIDHILIV